MRIGVGSSYQQRFDDCGSVVVVGFGCPAQGGVAIVGPGIRVSSGREQRLNNCRTAAVGSGGSVQGSDLQRARLDHNSQKIAVIKKGS